MYINSVNFYRSLYPSVCLYIDMYDLSDAQNKGEIKLDSHQWFNKKQLDLSWIDDEHASNYSDMNKRQPPSFSFPHV